MSVRQEGYYWVREEVAPGMKSLANDGKGEGPQIMFWDSKRRHWYSAGWEVPVGEDEITVWSDRLAEPDGVPFSQGR